MSTDITGSRVAIVTGSSRGIGAAIARRLAADGLRVIVNYAGRVADAEAVVESITAAGGTAHALQADVADPAQVTTLFAQTTALLGGVDVLVNNAG
jgi:3-oxoacyl-[acyl-carrier protein] reductase